MYCNLKNDIRFVQLDINKNMQEVINFANGDPTNLDNYTSHGVMVDSVDGRVEVKNGYFVVNLFGIRVFTAVMFYNLFEIK